MILTVLVVSIFIVYGMTLLIVQGSIFNPLRKKLALHIDKLHAYMNPSEVDVLNLIEKRPNRIPQKLLSIYKDLENKISTTSPDHSQFEDIVKLYNDTRLKIQSTLTNKRTNRFRKIRLGFYEMIQKLTACMMCTGFWIGVIVPIICLVFHISIFSVPLVMVLPGPLLNEIIGLVIIGAFFSGTTWAIHCFVDMLDEVKEYITRK